MSDSSGAQLLGGPHESDAARNGREVHSNLLGVMPCCKSLD